MKLRQYAILRLLLPLFMIMAIWGVIFHISLMRELREETDKVLTNLKVQIIKRALTDSSFIAEENVDILMQYYLREIPKSQADLSRNEFYDSVLESEFEMEDIPVRVLRSCFKNAENKYYELIITTSVQEKEDLEQTVILGVSILFFLLFICVILVLNFVLKKGLTPLYKLISWLKKYKLGKRNIPLEGKTSIEEFCVLYSAAKAMTKRNDEIYAMQEHFVGNASHELQTPLSVCLNKIELLADNPECTEQQLIELDQLHRQLSSLAKINKSLLLLSRIEGHQFLETTEVNIVDIISDVLDNYEEIYEEKHIKIVRNIANDIKATMNLSLTQVLLTNLVKNAFVYNKQNGIIEISIKNKTLKISNTSNFLKLDTEQIFDRYKKMNVKKESIGLGLNIVRVIAERYNIKIDYDFIDGIHQFKLEFI